MLTLRVVPDKSISHRVLYYALLARGVSRIRNLSPAEDIRRTLRVVRALGGRVERDGDDLRLQGVGRILREPSRPLYAGNSGTTVRIGLGVAAMLLGVTVWYGDASLSRRPMDRVLEPLAQRGIRFLAREDRFLPLSLRGGRPGPFSGRLPVASAQVKSALLFSGLFAEGPTRIVEPAPSRDHTERLFRYAGLPLTVGKDGTILLEPVTVLPPLDLTIPGDPSAAAFFATWAVLRGVPLAFPGLLLNPRRTRFFALLQRMGVGIRMDLEEKIPEPVGRLEVHPERPLRPVDVAPDEVPQVVDEVFLLALLASQAEGVSRFHGLAELRVKESDRLAMTARILREAGIAVQELPDGWEIPGPQRLQKPRRWVATKDHRMVMLQAVILGVFGEVPPASRLRPARVSDPWFLENMHRCVDTSGSSVTL